MRRGPETSTEKEGVAMAFLYCGHMMPRRNVAGGAAVVPRTMNSGMRSDPMKESMAACSASGRGVCSVKACAKKRRACPLSSAQIVQLDCNSEMGWEASTCPLGLGSQRAVRAL